MKKEIIIILSILILAVLAGGFWFVKNNREVKIVQQKSQDDNIRIKDNTKFGTRLTEEEIEIVKNNDYFVWYEIPELGIRFKVTPDTKEDMGYNIRYVTEIDNNGKNLTAYLYSKSVTIFLGSDYCFHNNKFQTRCSDGAIDKVSVKQNNKTGKDHIWACREDRILINTNDGVICFTGSQSPVLFGSQYEEYSKIIKDKNFGIYLNTTEQIK